MIPASEIATIVEVTVNAVRRRSFTARAADRRDLVQEAWLVALESLPNARRVGAQLGPYLGRALAVSLAKAARRWSAGLDVDGVTRWSKNMDVEAEFEPEAVDPSPSAEDLLRAREAMGRSLGRLNDADRTIVTHLLGIDGGRAAEAKVVARVCRVTVGKVYQARAELARRAREVA